MIALFACSVPIFAALFWTGVVLWARRLGVTA